MQYVRLVSTPSSTSTNVVTVGKTKTAATLQTVGVTQKIGGQQIVKVCERKRRQKYLLIKLINKFTIIYWWIQVVPLNTGNQTLRNVAPKTSMASSSQRIIIPASTSVGGQQKNTVTIPASALSQLTSGQAVLSTNSNIVVLPAQYLQQVSIDY